MSDGIRTRDVQIHSLALYQLSYAHRIPRRRFGSFVASAHIECQRARDGCTEAAAECGSGASGKLFRPAAPLRIVQGMLCRDRACPTLADSWPVIKGTASRPPYIIFRYRWIGGTSDCLVLPAAPVYA